MKYEPNISPTSPIKLNIKDKKIIKHLELNSRQSYSAIAKKVGLSRESVRYRVNQLEQKGVIQDYKVVIDVNKLDYLNYHLFISLTNPDIAVEGEIIKKITALPFVRTLIKFSGDFDFEIALIAKTVIELDQNLNLLFHGLRQYIKKQKILIIAKNYLVRNLPKNFIDIPDEEVYSKPKQITIEDTDLHIIKAMKDQANMPIYEIAQKAGLTQDVVSYRLKKMQEGKFILNYTLGLNYYTLNYQVYAILLNLDQLYGDTEAMLNEFFHYEKNMLWAVKTIGEYNVLAYVCTQSPTELHDTITRLRTTFKEKIIDYKTLIMYQKYKYTFVPEIILKK